MELDGTISRFAILRGIFFFLNSTIRLLVRPSYNNKYKNSKTLFFWELRGVVCIRGLYTVSIFPGVYIACSYPSLIAYD